MSEVSATASLGMKIGQFSPHHSITIKRSVPDDYTDEQLVEAADKTHELARRLVEKKVNQDVQDHKKATGK